MSGEKITQKDLTVLEYANRWGRVTSSDIVKTHGITHHTARDRLHRMVRLGLLWKGPQHANKPIRYFPTERKQ